MTSSSVVAAHRKIRQRTVDNTGRDMTHTIAPASFHDSALWLRHNAFCVALSVPIVDENRVALALFHPLVVPVGIVWFFPSDFVHQPLSCDVRVTTRTHTPCFGVLLRVYNAAHHPRCTHCSSLGFSSKSSSLSLLSSSGTFNSGRGGWKIPCWVNSCSGRARSIMRMRIEDEGMNGAMTEGDGEEDEHEEEEDEEKEEDEDKEDEEGGVYSAGKPTPPSKSIGVHLREPASPMDSHSRVCFGSHRGSLAHWRNTVVHALSSFMSVHPKRLQFGVPASRPAMSTPPLSPSG